MSRFLRLIGLIALVLAVIGIAFVAPVHAATVTLSSGARCDYATVAGDQHGNRTYTCAAALTVTQPPAYVPPTPSVPVYPPPAGPAPGAPVGCATAAPVLGTFTGNAQKIELRLAPGQPAAVAFVPRPGTIMEVSTTETTGTPPEADHEVTVSRCPGDFTPVWPCRYHANFNGGNLFLHDATRRPVPIWKCAVEPGQAYYMNVRQVSRSVLGASSCPLDGGCPVRVQVQNY